MGGLVPSLSLSLPGSVSVSIKSGRGLSNDVRCSEFLGGDGIINKRAHSQNTLLAHSQLFTLEI